FGLLWLLVFCRLRQGYGVPRRTHFGPFIGVLRKIFGSLTPKDGNFCSSPRIRVFVDEGKSWKGCFGRLPVQRTRSDGHAFKPTREPRVVPGSLFRRKGGDDFRQEFETRLLSPLARRYPSRLHLLCR